METKTEPSYASGTSCWLIWCLDFLCALWSLPTPPILPPSLSLLTLAVGFTDETSFCILAWKRQHWASKRKLGQTAVGLACPRRWVWLPDFIWSVYPKVPCGLMFKPISRKRGPCAFLLGQFPQILFGCFSFTFIFICTCYTLWALA